MPSFRSDGLQLAFRDDGPRDGHPILLVHGFASSAKVNWVDPGWVETLTKAGYRTIAFDHRGHGASDKPHEGRFYTPGAMASDCFVLMDTLGIEQATFFGYSMGARVTAFAALAAPERIDRIVLGGLGIGLVKGVGDWDPIAAALRAPSLDAVTDPKGRMFRAFADKTRSDREALAACIETSRQELTAGEVGRIRQPVLVGVGTADDIAGSPEELARLLPNARAFAIERRDHMLAVGDRTFKQEVLDFLAGD